jgi:hypothetical protein
MSSDSSRFNWMSRGALCRVTPIGYVLYSSTQTGIYSDMLETEQIAELESAVREVEHLRDEVEV